VIDVENLLHNPAKRNLVFVAWHFLFTSAKDLYLCWHTWFPKIMLTISHISFRWANIIFPLRFLIRSIYSDSLCLLSDIKKRVLTWSTYTKRWQHISLQYTELLLQHNCHREREIERNQRRKISIKSSVIGYRP
jgi:hypothetical protein